jgi:hypothetical protein
MNIVVMSICKTLAKEKKGALEFREHIPGSAVKQKLRCRLEGSFRINGLCRRELDSDTS